MLLACLVVLSMQPELRTLRMIENLIRVLMWFITARCILFFCLLWDLTSRTWPNAQCREKELHSDPLVFLTSGGMSKECKMFINRLANLFGYSSSCGFSSSFTSLQCLPRGLYAGDDPNGVGWWLMVRSGVQVRAVIRVVRPLTARTTVSNERSRPKMW